MPGTAGWKLGRTRANVVVGIAAVVVVGALVLVGSQLRDTQASSREQLLERFHDRAAVVSALMQAVISSAAATSEQTQRYGAEDVDDAALDRAVAEGRLAYAVLLDGDGVIAQSSTLAPAARSRVLASRTARATLSGAPVWLSDAEPDGRNGPVVIDLAVAFETPAGRRVLVSGVPTTMLSGFLSSYLQRVPGNGSSAYVVDGRGAVVAARDARTKIGETVTEPGLVEALRGGPSGEFTGDRRFTTAPIPSSTWRIVLTAPESVLLDSVSGARKWLPWLIYAALGILAFGFLALCGDWCRAAPSCRWPTSGSRPATRAWRAPTRCFATRPSWRARTPSSSSSRRSPRTTCRSRCARCRRSPRSSTATEQRPAVGGGPGLPAPDERSPPAACGR